MEVSNENSSAKAILAGWNISTNGMISENKKMRLYSTPYYNSEEEIAVGNYSPRSKGWYIIAGVGEKPDDSNYTPAAFGVDANGYMCCKNGYVGNWTIDSRGIGNEIHYFYNDWDTNFKVQVGSAEKNDWRLLMGRNNQNKAYFGVDANGFLYCAGGEIGGWYISHYNLSKNPGSNKEGSIVFLNGSMETVETICGVVKDDWVIGCGKRIKSGNFNYNDVYNFGIDSNGNMYCQNAHLSGILECIAPSDYTGNLATFG